MSDEMFPIKILGDGNCMYNAYGVGLMYYLQSLQAPGELEISDTAKKLFSKLELSEDTISTLSVLLLHAQNTAKLGIYAPTEQNIIRKLLAAPLRKKATDVTRALFINNQEKPHNNKLFIEAAYKFRQILNSEMEPPFNEFISFYFNPDDEGAEIYRVSGVEDAMRVFCNEKCKGLKTDLEKAAASLRKINDNETVIMNQLNLYADSQVDKLIVEFFLRNDCQWLEAYCRHLNTNGVWGTVQTLTDLHEFMRGERQVEIGLGSDNDPRFDYVPEHDIPLTVFEHGQLRTSADETPVMVLHHNGGDHWDLSLPPKLLLENIELHLQRSESADWKPKNRKMIGQLLLAHNEFDACRKKFAGLREREKSREQKEVYNKIARSIDAYKNHVLTMLIKQMQENAVKNQSLELNDSDVYANMMCVLADINTFYVQLDELHEVVDTHEFAEQLRTNIVNLAIVEVIELQEKLDKGKDEKSAEKTVREIKQAVGEIKELVTHVRGYNENEQRAFEVGLNDHAQKHKGGKVPNPSQITEIKTEKLTQNCAQLRNAIVCARLDYIHYGVRNRSRFSLWHRHGAKGRTNAKKFVEGLPEDDTKILEAALDYVKNGSGNKHEHSFRTYLLRALFNQTGSDLGELTLSQVSKNFDVLAALLNKDVEPDVPSPKN